MAAACKWISKHVQLARIDSQSSYHPTRCRGKSIRFACHRSFPAVKQQSRLATTPIYQHYVQQHRPIQPCLLHNHQCHHTCRGWGCNPECSTRQTSHWVYEACASMVYQPARTKSPQFQSLQPHQRAHPTRTRNACLTNGHLRLQCFGGAKRPARPTAALQSTVCQPSDNIDNNDN
jgi:hypothetical protein